MVDTFLTPNLTIWLISELNLAPWQKVDLATLNQGWGVGGKMSDFDS